MLKSLHNFPTDHCWELDTITSKKPKETTPKTVYKEDKYKKCFTNVMIDENDVSVDDSDEFIDDMMFMDLMDED